MIYVAFLTFLATGLLQIATAEEKACWAPDGDTKADNETYVACNKLGIEQDGVHSSCCNLDGKNRDTCDPTGLCLNDGVFFRGFCTDPSWKSPACIDICTDDTGGGSSNDTVEITACLQDGTYCCGRDNQTCCGTDDAFRIPTDASVIADDLAETVTVTPQSSSSAYKNATISLAVVFGVGALVGLGVLLWLFRKNKSLKQQLQDHKSQPMMRESQAPSMSFRDSVIPDNTDANTNYTGPSSPRQHWSNSSWKPAASSVPEADCHQRYSELDASVALDAIQSNNGSPRPEQTPYNESTFQPSQSPPLQFGQHPQ